MTTYLCLVEDKSDLVTRFTHDKIINLNDTSQCHYDYISKSHLKIYGYYGSFISNQAIDLLNLSLFTYFADKLEIRSSTFDAWTRSIKIIIPVIEIDKFVEIKPVIEEMLSYLTGDHWIIDFYKRDYTTLEESENNVNDVIIDTKLEFDTISMLSGGLDSYIGAINLLEDRNITPLFISVYGGGNDVTPYQKNVKELLINKYNLNDTNFMSFHAKALHPVEQTTRSRSFVFFSHAIAMSSLQKSVDKIIIPENGFISLNVPLTNSRLGSSSTRTTHPYYMKLLNVITKELGIDVKLINPYQFKTKGEMVRECLEYDFLKTTLHHTMSCSHSSHARWTSGNMSSHCGYCVPCIIRRASIKYGNIVDESIYRVENITLNKASMSSTIYSNINSFRFALNRFYSKKEHGFDIQISGPLETQIDDYVSIYERGMAEISDLYYKYNEK